MNDCNSPSGGLAYVDFLGLTHSFGFLVRFIFIIVNINITYVIVIINTIWVVIININKVVDMGGDGGDSFIIIYRVDPIVLGNQHLYYIYYLLFQ